MRKTIAAYIAEIDALNDADLREEYLIEAASRYRAVPAEIAAAPYPRENQVPACESGVYVFSRPRPDGTFDFYYAVENPHGISAKALAVLLQEALSGAPRSDLEQLSADAVKAIFGPHLTIARDQGMRNMIRATRKLAGI